jgi:HAD superfamily hydrolase (TIGR01509 family)
VASGVGHPVDLVIFDCDGVLIDSEVLSIRCLVEGLGAVGYMIDPDAATAAFVGRSWTSIVEAVEADWRRPLPKGFAEDIDQRIIALMPKELQPIDGVAAVLSGLEKKRCVASSSTMAWIRQGLTATDLIDHLDPHLFSASMVEKSKPAPDVFLYAAERMGAAPDRAVVVEDSLAGVQAGVAAGMTVIGFTGGGHVVGGDHGDKLRAAGAGHIVEHMAALPDLLNGTT